MLANFPQKLSAPSVSRMFCVVVNARTARFSISLYAFATYAKRRRCVATFCIGITCTAVWGGGAAGPSSVNCQPPKPNHTRFHPSDRTRRQDATSVLHVPHRHTTTPRAKTILSRVAYISTTLRRTALPNCVNIKTTVNKSPTSTARPHNISSTRKDAHIENASVLVKVRSFSTTYFSPNETVPRAVMALSGGAAGTSNGNNANSSSSGGGGLEHGIEMESLHHRFHNHPHLQQQLLQQQQQQLFDGGGSGGGGAMGGSSGPGIGPGTVSGSLAGGSVTGGIAGIGGSGGGTPKPKRAAVTKKLQFSTPEYSETSIPAVPVVVSRLTPSRKR